GDLARYALNETAVLLQPGSTFFELIDRAIVLITQLRDRIGLPEEIGHFVNLRHKGRPEFVKNHGLSFDSTTKLFPDRFPFANQRRLGEDLALIYAVERLAELGTTGRADNIAADLFQERKLLWTGIERNEVHLHSAFALAPDLARDALRTAP